MKTLPIYLTFALIVVATVLPTVCLYVLGVTLCIVTIATRHKGEAANSQ